MKPDSQELGLFSRSRAFWFSSQWLDVVDGQDRGGDEPRQAEDGAGDDQDEDDQQVQMVATAFL